jgi:hypothetical protein
MALFSLAGSIFSTVFDSPPAAARDKRKICGDTPLPGKGFASALLMVGASSPKSKVNET